MHDSRELVLARLPSGIPIRTTVHVYGEGSLVDGDDGPTLELPDDGGPVVYAQAAQHGREVNGAAVLRRLHDRLVGDDGAGGSDASADLDGTLVTVPVANPLTFDHVSYTTPEALDSVHSNMNRCWPGDAEGTLHERMAARLWSFASGADAVVDLHTGSPSMLTHTVYMRGDEDCRGLAEAFGTDLLLADVRRRRRGRGVVRARLRREVPRRGHPRGDPDDHAGARTQPRDRRGGGGDRRRRHDRRPPK